MNRSQSWKELERKTAKLLGGTRNVRGSDFSESMPDCDHAIFSIECKYRTKASSAYYNYLSLIKKSGYITVLKHKDRCVLTLDSFSSKVYSPEHYVKPFPVLLYELPRKKGLNKFFEDALRQAEGYNKFKFPLVVFKKKGYHGEIVYLKEYHFNCIYTGEYKNDKT